MSSLLQDLRYSARLLFKQPGFTAVAVIMLALGIGANTAIFSVINATLLRPLPFENPDRLVIVTETVRRDTVETRPASYPDFIDWRERNQTFEDLAAFDDPGLNITGDGAERITAEIVSASYFSILGVNAKLGRTFLPEEDRTPDASPVTVVSHKLWQRRFNGDPNVINKTLKINEKDFTIVGVMPEGFAGVTGAAETWIPMTMVSAIRSASVLQHRGSRWHQVIGRLKPAVTVEQAQADLTAIAEGLEQANPGTNKDRGVQVVAAHEAVVGNLRPTLIVLLCAVAFVLLIACVNVANLLLARASVRQKEIAIRTALGAGRARLVRQMLTESLLLSALGGALGLLLAVWGIDLIVAFMGNQLPTLIKPGIDLGVLSFTLLVSFLTGIVFGIVPALQASKTGLNEVLKEGGRGTSGGARRHRLRRALVVAELAMALVLLTGAGLLLRSFQRLQTFDPGFKADNVITMRMNLPRSYTAAQKVAYHQQVIERASVLPGVSSVGTGTDTPFDGTSSATIAAVETADPDLNEVRIYLHQTSPNFFTTMGIPLIKGRDFTPQDVEGSPLVAVISQAMAKRLWPNEDPLTKRLSLDEDKDRKPIWTQVVGVVGDVKYRTLINDQNNDPDVYLPYAQIRGTALTLASRSVGDPAGLTESLRAQLQSIDPNIPVYGVTTMKQRLADITAPARFSTLLLGVFSLIALLLAVVGIYGVMSYTVTQRTHEIGIRMALGASRSDVMRLVVGEGVWLVAGGVGLGLAGAILATRVLESQLYSVSATDPLTFSLVSLLLAGVALGASFLPARRAMKVDPMVALRYE